jgi:SAM-dependent methyltransferase
MTHAHRRPALGASVLERALCAFCAGPLDARAAALACGCCGQGYPRVGPIPVLLPQPQAHVELWRRQLALLTAHGAETRAGLEAEAAAPGLLPGGRARLAALARAVAAQVDDFARLVGPALGGPLDGAAPGLPRGVVEYAYYLYRDWGWPADESQENQDALDAIAGVITDGALGDVLVLGAGGGRLAYDLHRACGARETVALDIDPYLLVIAEAVVRGRAARLTEASLNVSDAARVAATWTLAAPAGPLDDAHFHFLLANGLAPPFAPATFDTIVTPWFIDRVPTDVGAFLETVARLLRPGGRWLNHGPLLYPPETPLPRRHGREELFELAAEKGFSIRRWVHASRHYLVSPLTGAGKIERVLTFEARRAAD